MTKDIYIPISREIPADEAEKFAVMRERLSQLRQPILRCLAAATSPQAASAEKSAAPTPEEPPHLHSCAPGEQPVPIPKPSRSSRDQKPESQ
jgi:hypothetical protein